LTQSGDYPLGNRVIMTVSAPKPVSMALRLRIPAWAGPATAIRVADRAGPAAVPGQFATIAREWRDGDRVDLFFDMQLRAEAVDQHYRDRVAMMVGPLALFATGDRFTPLTKAQLMSLRQTAPGTAEWTLDGGTGRQSFRPYFAMGEEPSRLYQRVVGGDAI